MKQRFNLGKLNPRHTAVSVLAAAGLLMPIIGAAQGGGVYQDRSYNHQQDYVSIYEHCDYKGARRDISPGEFRRMRDLDFDNDKVSSMRVPRGMEAVIFEHDKFKGDYARVDRDVACFDSKWNDQVSSMKVVSTRQSHDSYRDRSSRDNRPRYGEDNRRGEGYNGSRARDRDNRNRNNQPRGGSFNDNVNANNVSKVVFNGKVLQKISADQWQIRDPQYGSLQYRETRRDSSSVYMRNEYTKESIRVDLFSNDVTMIGSRGRAQKFAIQQREAARITSPVTNTHSEPAVSNHSEPSRRIRGECFDYRAYTLGGSGGVRFHGKKGFHRFDKKPYQGRVCHNGTLNMEINKTSPDTAVVIEIQGRQFRFGRGEKEHELKNSWYRKNVKLKVSR